MSEGPTHPVIEHFILLLHAGQECVLGDVCRPSAELSIGSLDLTLERLDIAWQETVEAEGLALFFGECAAFVEQWRL